MKLIVSKLLVAFVFLMLSMVPYIGPVFLGLSMLWAIWATILIMGLMRDIMVNGFEENEFANRPD